MSGPITKIRKYVSYVFMGLGVLVMLIVVTGIVLWLWSGTQTYRGATYDSVGMPAAPTGISGGSGSFLGGVFDVSRETAPSSPTTQGIDEGVLTERKVIKNGSLSLLVQKAEEAAEGIKAIAGRLNGLVIDAQIYEVSEGTKSGYISIKVPAERFEEAVEDVKKLALKVERETVSARDVTEQFVDLEAQLRNFRAEEEQYLAIMERADKVEDILRVAQQLSNVRNKIERIEGQLQFLSRQVDMSTITVNLTEEADVELFGIRWRPLFTIKQSFRNMVEGLTGYIDALIGLVFSLPVIALWLVTIAVIAILGWKALRWLYHRYFKKQDEASM